MREADNPQPYCAVVKKSGSHKFLEPLWACMACYGTASPYRKHFKLWLVNLENGLQVEGKVSSTEIDLWRRAARISRLVKLRNEVIRETMRVTQTILDRMENNTFMW